jgi:hypothetical protein
MPSLRQARLFLVALAPVAMLLTGCSKKPPEATPTPPEPTLPEAASPVASAAAPSAPIEGNKSIGGALHEEAKARVPGKPSVEEVFALCEKLGAPVPTKEQTVARTYRASYCVGGFTADKKMSINVCEYPDEATVDAGAEISNKLFKALAERRHVLMHKSTTLTLFEAVPGDDTRALTKKLGDAFLAM